MQNLKSDDVLELVHTIMHTYRSLQYRFLRDGPLTITHMDGKVLEYFEAHPGATQGDLAKHSRRDRAQLARLIMGLRDQGLVVGAVDPDDRRSVRLSLTRSGKKVQSTLQDHAKELRAKAVLGLTASETAQLCALLQRVNINLRESVKGGDDDV